MDRIGSKIEYSIEEGDEYFWDIPLNEFFDMKQAPEKLTVGEVGDCVAMLKKFAADPYFDTGLAFIWLSYLLRAIGEKEIKE
jgi:hypothetical protein